MTMADVEKRAEHMPWGRPDEVAERLIAEADKAGANTLLVSLNRGSMPHEMFIEQIRRFGREVMPAVAGARGHARSDRRGRCGKAAE